jgi:hypothetical protein
MPKVSHFGGLLTEQITTHQHVCPDCGAESWHETTGPVWCANKASANGGVIRLLCDLCWGMTKPARVPAHELST